MSSTEIYEFVHFVNPLNRMERTGYPSQSFYKEFLRFYQTLD